MIYVLGYTIGQQELFLKTAIPDNPAKLKLYSVNLASRRRLLGNYLLISSGLASCSNYILDDDETVLLQPTMGVTLNPQMPKTNTRTNSLHSTTLKGCEFGEKPRLNPSHIHAT